jgi:hypothetical protein
MDEIKCSRYFHIIFNVYLTKSRCSEINIEKKSSVIQVISLDNYKIYYLNFIIQKNIF